MLTRRFRGAAIFASSAVVLALSTSVGAQDLSAIDSGNGPIGFDASIGGANGIGTGVGIGTSKGVVDVGVDASVGGSSGVVATGDTSVLDGKSAVDSTTSASIGGTGGLTATSNTSVLDGKSVVDSYSTVSAGGTTVEAGVTVGGASLATVDVNVGGRTVSPGPKGNAGTGSKSPPAAGTNTISPTKNNLGYSALSGAQSGKISMMKRRCIDIVANAESYDRALVELCLALAR